MGCLQRGRGAAPIVRESGGSPPEAGSFFAFGRPVKAVEFDVLN